MPKSFSEHRKSLAENMKSLEEGVELPPNILILRRQSIRQFPGHTLVALYHNDKLDQYFSIPFGGEENSIITPSSMKEDQEQLDEEKIWHQKGKTHHADVYRIGDGDGKEMYQYRIHDSSTGKEVHRGVEDSLAKSKQTVFSHLKEVNLFDKDHEDVIEVIEENVIEHLRGIKEFHTRKAIKHADGKKTTVDPTTAHALLTVHDALGDENKEKFAQQLTKSKAHFNRMLDFTWKSVK